MKLQEPTHWNQAEYDRYGQWNNWLNLLDIANGIRYGFHQYRLPKPGQPVVVSTARDRCKNIETEWAREQHTRDFPKSFAQTPTITDCSTETQCYLHTVLKSVPRPEPTTVVYEYSYQTEWYQT